MNPKTPLFHRLKSSFRTASGYLVSPRFQRKTSNNWCLVVATLVSSSWKFPAFHRHINLNLTLIHVHCTCVSSNRLKTGVRDTTGTLLDPTEEGLFLDRTRSAAACIPLRICGLSSIQAIFHPVRDIHPHGNGIYMDISLSSSRINNPDGFKC